MTNSLRSLENDIEYSQCGLEYSIKESKSSEIGDIMLFPKNNPIMSIWGYDTNEKKSETDYDEKYIVELDFDLGYLKALEMIGQMDIISIPTMLMQFEQQIMKLTIDNDKLGTYELREKLEYISDLITFPGDKKSETLTAKSLTRYQITIFDKSKVHLEFAPLFTNNYFLVYLIRQAYIYEYLNDRVDFDILISSTETLKEPVECNDYEEYLEILMKMSEPLINDISSYNDNRNINMISNEIKEAFDKHDIPYAIALDGFDIKDKYYSTSIEVRLFEKLEFNNSMNRFENHVGIQVKDKNGFQNIRSVNNLIVYYYSNLKLQNHNINREYFPINKYNDDFKNIDTKTYEADNVKIVKTAITSNELYDEYLFEETIDTNIYRGYHELSVMELSETYEIININIHHGKYLLAELVIYPNIISDENMILKHELSYVAKYTSFDEVGRVVSSRKFIFDYIEIPLEIMKLSYECRNDILNDNIKLYSNDIFKLLDLWESFIVDEFVMDNKYCVGMRLPRTKDELCQIIEQWSNYITFEVINHNEHYKNLILSISDGE